MKLEVLAVMFATLSGQKTSLPEEALSNQHSNEQMETYLYERLKRLEEIAIKYDGLTIKSVRDTLLVVFPQVSKAASAALEMLAHYQHHETQNHEQVSIAIHAGELAMAVGDVYGETVNNASRISAVAEPSEILVSEATRELLKQHSFELSALGGYEFKGLFYPIEIFRLEQPHSQQSGRTVLLRRASSRTRILVGTWDIMLGAVLMLAWSLILHSSEILGTLMYTHHMPFELFELHGALSNGHTRALWDHGSPLSRGKLVKLAANDKAQALFSGPSGTYDVVLGADLHQGGLTLTMGAHVQPIKPNWGLNGLGIKLIAENIALKTGDLIQVQRTDKPSKDSTHIDFIAFTPSNKPAYRPHGVERSYRFYYLWKSIDYDDYNFHMFVLPIPCFAFFQMLISMTFLKRSMGCVVMGVYLRNSSTRETPGILAVLLRLSTWCIYPLLALQNLGSAKSPSDWISGTELVVKISPDAADH
jgi:hypothetical protein